jgi:hypothetical protein
MISGAEVFTKLTVNRTPPSGRWGAGTDHHIVGEPTEGSQELR